MCYDVNMFEECLYFNSNAMARAVTRLWSEAYGRYGLSPSHAFLLRVVLAKPGLLPGELAEELDLSRSTVTRFLDSLEQRNFLIRKQTKEDGREFEVHPTSKAKAIQRDLNSTGAKLTIRMGELFGERDLSRTVKMLRKMKKSLDDEQA